MLPNARRSIWKSQIEQVSLVLDERTSSNTRHPRPSPQQGNKRKRQETEEEEGGKTKGWGEEALPMRNEGLPLDSEVTDITQRQMAVYKEKGGNPC